MVPIDRYWLLMAIYGAYEATRGGERLCRQGEHCGAGHGVAPFRVNNTASDTCSSSRRYCLSQASCKAAAVAIALLDHVRIEGQKPK